MHNVITIINQENPGFNFLYSVRQRGEKQDECGRIAARRKTTQPLNLSKMFYCNFSYNRKEYPLSYILAQTEEERKLLTTKGFISVQERFDAK